MSTARRELGRHALRRQQVFGQVPAGRVSNRPLIDQMGKAYGVQVLVARTGTATGHLVISVGGIRLWGSIRCSSSLVRLRSIAVSRRTDRSTSGLVWGRDLGVDVVGERLKLVVDLIVDTVERIVDVVLISIVVTARNGADGEARNRDGRKGCRVRDDGGSMSYS